MDLKIFEELKQPKGSTSLEKFIKHLPPLAPSSPPSSLSIEGIGTTQPPGMLFMQASKIGSEKDKRHTIEKIEKLLSPSIEIKPKNA